MIVEIDRIVVMTLGIGESVRQEAGDRSDLIYKIRSETFRQRCHFQKMKGSKRQGHLGNNAHLNWFFGRENCSSDLAGSFIACPPHPELKCGREQLLGERCLGLEYWEMSPR
jgi:hypothetical protein